MTAQAQKSLVEALLPLIQETLVNEVQAFLAQQAQPAQPSATAKLVARNEAKRTRTSKPASRPVAKLEAPANSPAKASKWHKKLAGSARVGHKFTYTSRRSGAVSTWQVIGKASSTHVYAVKVA